MKKVLLYAIIFISLFVGTATCVVVNGYNNYKEQQEENALNQTTIEESPLTSLASNVLNAENYSGTFTISDSSNNTQLDGTFSYINNDEITAEIKLNGKVNKLYVNADIKLINDKIYLDFNDQKLMLSTNDILTALNSVIESINTTSNSDIPKIDMEYAQSLLSNITTTQLDSGYLIQATLPNLCDIFITTNLEYIPSQILITNINLGGNIYTINIKASQTRKEINQISATDYLNITPALSYLSPLINTFNQGNLCAAGTLNLNGTKINVKTYVLTDNKIIGEVELNNFTIKFQIENDCVLIDLYGNVFKLSFNDLTELINKYIPKTISTETTSLNHFIDNLNLSTTIKDNKISEIKATYDNLSLVLEIGKTIYTPSQIYADTYLNKSDIITLIDGYKNILSTEYSLDINISNDEISAFGNAYIKLNNNYNGIDSLYFDGTINDIECTLIYSSSETFINVADNKIKLQNSSLEKIVEIVMSYVGFEGDSNINFSAFEDLSILNNIKLSGRTISFISDEINAKITSYTNTYKLQATISNMNVNATIYPGDSCYSRIIKSINKADFKSFDNTVELLTALTKTLEKNELHFAGNIDIKIFDITYKNIKVDVKTNKTTGKIILTLDNLPTDSVLTYLSNTYYENQKSVITIYNGEMTIYTTVTLRATNKVVCITNKTIKLSEFSLDNLYDILSMRKTIINQIKDKSTSNSGILTNLSTDCLDVYKTYTTINLDSLAPDVFTTLLVQFNYDTEITKATLYCDINNLLFINISLSQY